MAVVGGVAGMLSAQTASSPAFEAASVKPTAPGARFIIALPSLEPGGRYTATNVNLAVLVGAAFGPHRREEIIGAPEWFTTALFAVVAEAGHDAASDLNALSKQVPAMMRALLEDRFKLRAHTELRQGPVYALVKNKADGGLGPQLKHSALDCPLPGAPFVQSPEPAALACGFRLRAQGSISGYGQPMQAFAAFLEQGVGRVVVDRTELAGAFDLSLRWDPSTTPVGPSAPSASELPSFFTALKEQLGLKLESTTGPVDVLVIDHVEKPTDD